MFNSTVLEIGIGIVFVYFVLSLAASALAEAISQILKWRAKDLEQGIMNILSDPTLAKRFYDHPLVKALYRGNRKPSYIPTETFSTVLLDLERTFSTEGLQLPEQVSGALRTLRSDIAGAVSETKVRVEQWFDQTMERVGGWYKRRVGIAIWVIALVFTAAANADTLGIVDALSKDRTLRDAVVAAAHDAAGDNVARPPEETRRSIDIVAQRVEELTGLGIPLGWSDAVPADDDATWWFMKIVGLLLTAVAISLGAPFWFGVLSKLVSLRGGGTRPGEEKATKKPTGGQGTATDVTTTASTVPPATPVG